MTTFRLHIDTDNAAFYDEYDDDYNPHAELAALLRKVADRVVSGEDIGQELTILDSNGNTVGRFALETWTREGAT